MRKNSEYKNYLNERWKFYRFCLKKVDGVIETIEEFERMALEHEEFRKSWASRIMAVREKSLKTT